MFAPSPQLGGLWQHHILPYNIPDYPHGIFSLFVYTLLLNLPSFVAGATSVVDNSNPSANTTLFISNVLGVGQSLTPNGGTIQRYSFQVLIAALPCTHLASPPPHSRPDPTLSHPF